MINLLQFLQVALIFLAFLTIVYWIFELANPAVVQFATPFFSFIKALTNVFYNQMANVNGVLVDFSYFVSAIVMIIISGLLRLLVEHTENLEKLYDKFYFYLRKKTQDLFNIELKQEYLMSETRVNKTLLLIKFRAKNREKDKFFNKNVEIGVAEKEKEILSDFHKTISGKMKCEFRFLNDGLLLYFKDIKEIDKQLDTIIQVTKETYSNFFEQGWEIYPYYAIDVYNNEKEAILRVQKLILLIRLGLNSKILCPSTFRQRYSLLKEQQYIINSEGIYKLTSADEEVFSIKKK